jgi:hypothetical protein
MKTSSKVLGQVHPNTLTSMANLAYTWKSQGQDKEADRAIKASGRIAKTDIRL